MFVDANDFAWSACLCQRLEPHRTPKIVAIARKGFSEVQLRWSAMQRELYALHQGVLGHWYDLVRIWIRGKANILGRVEQSSLGIASGQTLADPR